MVPVRQHSHKFQHNLKGTWGGDNCNASPATPCHPQGIIRMRSKSNMLRDQDPANPNARIRTHPSSQRAMSAANVRALPQWPQATIQPKNNHELLANVARRGGDTSQIPIPHQRSNDLQGLICNATPQSTTIKTTTKCNRPMPAGYST